MDEGVIYILNGVGRFRGVQCADRPSHSWLLHIVLPTDSLHLLAEIPRLRHPIPLLQARPMAGVCAELVLAGIHCIHHDHGQLADDSTGHVSEHELRCTNSSGDHRPRYW